MSHLCEMSIFKSFSVLSLSLASLILLSSSPQPASSECKEQDKLTLLQIKSSFGNPSSMADWSNNTDCCAWNGVNCGASSEEIIYLWITNSNTSNRIPPEVGDLPDLRRLIISNHPNLAGPIPESITKLQNLQQLIVRGTSISGDIPRFLCDMRNLNSLDLSANDFSGPIPACFGSNLYIIDFSYNQLSGHIPCTLFKGYGGNETILNLRRNHLTGRIPLSFSALNFYKFDLSENNFIGDASHVFGRSKFTEEIHLANNGFSFDLSSVTYPLYLSWLDISHNRIRGSIDEQITELQGLGILDMSYNRLCGPIPSGGMMRPYDQSSFVHNKCLCGTPLPPCAN
ncbi:uncharacterized protein A4U43_UnF7760 [Asparagus officinalis]|uniref:Leucine-rich repeat-containing N-terminal plant-type domain-containing protein n=1 Tax=Asparagus officinalis TaxID=4686 RepID=A0A1R3L654_ASPOF|nr:polygalacturonase inhibitor-like [Asparagus officinalis]ONK55084.1 uncharacterized protein A4U43_UnF7760 [Asparagus officinalis]